MASHDIHQLLKAEQIVLDTDYAFSYNPKEQHDLVSLSGGEYELIIKDRKKAFLRKTKLMLHNLKGSSYRLWFEVSPKGRMHWHGYIRIHDLNEWFMHDTMMLMHYGAVCIKEITDRPYWQDYVTKQYKIWSITIQSLLYIDVPPSEASEAQAPKGIVNKDARLPKEVGSDVSIREFPKISFGSTDATKAKRVAMKAKL